jgi:hypothetical protein
MPFELLPEEAPQEKSESILSQIGRGAARTTARIGEQIAGAPGDIFSLINEFIARPTIETITNQPSVSYEETLLGKLLPPTSKHREATKKTFGELTEPQNKIESFLDNVTQDAAAIALTGAKGIGKNIFSSLAKATGANVLGDLVKDWTADEKKAGFAKLGSLFVLSMFDKPRAAKAVADLYKPLTEKVTKLNPVNASGLEMNLNNLVEKLSKGTLAPSEKFVVDEAKEILNKISAGKITPEELWAVKRSLNEKLSQILFQIPKKTDQVRARKMAKSILGNLDDTLKQTAKQDPSFYKDLKKADKAFGTIAKSNVIANFIEKNMKYNPITAGLGHLILGPVGSISAAAVVPYQTWKILYRIAKSPVLAKHYTKVLSAAASEDAIIMNRELKKLDHSIQKEEKSDKFILVD